MSERGQGGEPGAHTAHCNFMGETKAAQYYPNSPKRCSTLSCLAVTRSLKPGVVSESEETRSSRFGHLFGDFSRHPLPGLLSPAPPHGMLRAFLPTTTS